MAGQCECVVMTCMGSAWSTARGLPPMQGVMEANASRYHGKAPDEIEWSEPELQTCAVKEELARGIGQATKRHSRCE
jgi:hypothetical protein